MQSVQIWIGWENTGRAYWPAASRESAAASFRAIEHRRQAGERWRPRCLRPPPWGKELLAPKVTQDPVNDLGLLDAGDDPHRTTALLTDLDINLEHTLESFCPGHGKVRSHSDREGALGYATLLRFGFGHRRNTGDMLTASCRRYLCTKVAVGCEYAMVAREVDAWSWNKRRKPGNEIERLEHNMRGAIPPWSFERVAGLTLTGK